MLLQRRHFQLSLQIALLAVGLTVTGGSGSCRRQAPPAPAAGPASAPAEAQAWAKLQSLEREGLAAIEQQQHGRLTGVAGAMEQLRFHDAARARRRDGLIRSFRRQAADIKDALHRFLFTELSPLSSVKRKQFLAAGDRGREDAIQRSAEALAEHFHQAGPRHLRASDGLRSGTTDPATGLDVRFAGRAKSEWKKQFDRHFNSRMRALVLASGREG